MRNWILVIISLFFFLENSFAQEEQIKNDSTYQYWMNQGDGAFFMKKYTLCSECYEKASQFNPNDARAKFFAGKCYDLNSKEKEAQKNLIEAIKLDWETVDHLLESNKESYKYLKKEKRCWKKVQKEFKAQQEGINMALREEILLLESEYQNKKWMEGQHQNIPKEESKTEDEKRFANPIKKIISEHGLPTKKLVGRKASSAVISLVSNVTNLKDRESYLLQIKMAVENKEIDFIDYAQMIDILELGKGRPQIYGTQISYNGIEAKIVDEKKVNKRRAIAGLEPIEDFYERSKREYKFKRQKYTEVDFKKFTGGWDLVNIRDAETFEITFLPEQNLWVEFLAKGRLRFNRTANTCEMVYQATDRGRLIFTPTVNCTKKCCDDQKITQTLNYHDVIEFELYDEILFLIDTKGKLWEFKRKKYSKQKMNQDN